MNKKFVYQGGNNKKVILWCTANQLSSVASGWLIYLNCMTMRRLTKFKSHFDFYCFHTHTYPFAPTFNRIHTSLAISILYTFVSSQHPCESLRSPPKCCSYGRHFGILCDRKYEYGGVSCYVVTSVQVSINRLILSSRSNAGYGRCNNVWSVTNVMQTQNIFELISVHEVWVWISKHFSLCFMN